MTAVDAASLVLVLCDPFDLPALWAADRLERRGMAVEVVAGSTIGDALSWEHRVGTDGVASVEIGLADGRRISGTEPCGVLNRLTVAPTGRVQAVGGTDGDYAIQEMSALFLSWLAALPGPVVNRPSPQGLGGHWRHPATWAVLAGQAGLSAPPYRRNGDDSPTEAALPPAFRTGGDGEPGWRLPAVTAFVVGDEVVTPSPLPPEVRDGCRRLARLSGDTLLGADFQPGADGGWELVNASATPDLRLGGEPLVEVLIGALQT